MRLRHAGMFAASTVGAVACVTAFGSSGAGASTEQLQVIKTVSSSYIAPLQFAIDGKTTFVADSATSTLNRVGRATPLATGGDPSTGGDLAGVDVDPTTHAIAYTQSNGDHSDTRLTILNKDGTKVVANLSKYEKQHNPDQIIHYGVEGKVSSCVRQALEALPTEDGSPFPVKYRGGIDSHPYAVVSLGNGNWAVADAGGNDIVKVDAAGKVSTLGVLPSQPLTITSEFATANGLPSCVVGVTYDFEGVPTDVERGPNGGLFATSLPGGDGVAGSVYRVGDSGAVTQVATGFPGATNLAIDPATGDMYVAELGTGQIAKVVHGAPVPVASLPGVVGVEWARGHLFASTAPAVIGGTGPGEIVELG